jgi:transketolase
MKDAMALMDTEHLAQLIRLSVLRQIYDAGSGHPGGSLSCADILACVFGRFMDPEALRRQDLERNHFILSKGHAAPALYAALAEVGLIAQRELSTLRQLGSRLQGHPDRTRLPEVEMSTGSLGQGLSVGAGIAWWMAHQGAAGQVFVLLGDGELNEGQVWEAVAFSGAHHLMKLVAIVDANGIQNDGPVTEILPFEPYVAKFESFGWRAQEIDGHDHAEIVAALEATLGKRRPTVLIARTTKGDGVSFMEGNAEWHSHGLTDEQYRLAVEEVAAQ